VTSHERGKDRIHANDRSFLFADKFNFTIYPDYYVNRYRLSALRHLQIWQQVHLKGVTPGRHMSKPNKIKLLSIVNK